MISAKRLVQMAKKWQRMAALARKRLTLASREVDGAPCSTASFARKGCCVMYSADGIRFEVPLALLSSVVFIALLGMSQEEFGFASDDGRIVLPCDAAVMEYVMSLLRREASEEVQRAFVGSMVSSHCHNANGFRQNMGLGHQVPGSIF